MGDDVWVEVRECVENSTALRGRGSASTNCVLGAVKFANVCELGTCVAGLRGLRVQFGVIAVGVFLISSLLRRSRRAVESSEASRINF